MSEMSSAPQSPARVEFDIEAPDSHPDIPAEQFPIVVEHVEAHLSAAYLTDARAPESGEGCPAAPLETVPPQALINCALDIIDTAPTFDHIDASELTGDQLAVTVTVSL